MEKKEIMVMNSNQKVEEMEGARRATGISSTAALYGSGVKTVLSDPEVPEKAAPRRYTAEYKRRILRETEVCKEQGQLGARVHDKFIGIVDESFISPYNLIAY